MRDHKATHTMPPPQTDLSFFASPNLHFGHSLCTGEVETKLRSLQSWLQKHHSEVKIVTNAIEKKCWDRDTWQRASTAIEAALKEAGDIKGEFQQALEFLRKAYLNAN